MRAGFALTIHANTNDEAFTLCISCRVPIHTPFETVHHTYVDDMHSFLQYTRAASAHVGVVQQNALTDVVRLAPKATCVPTCHKCLALTQRFLQTRKQLLRKTPDAHPDSHQLVHPVFDIIRFICSGAAHTCIERRSIPQVMPNLARRIVFPDGRVQYNELVTSGPEVLQRVVGWIHAKRIQPADMKTLVFGCAAGYWLHNGLCKWGASRENMRAIRRYKRRASLFEFMDTQKAKEPKDPATNAPAAAQRRRRNTLAVPPPVPPPAAAEPMCPPSQTASRLSPPCTAP
eukprot:3934669-Rhodomonas_salina.2